MPKASFSSKDAYEVQLGFREGRGRIIEACSCVHQFPPTKKTGEQFPPATRCKLVIQRINPQTGKDTDDDPVEEYLGIANPNKDSGELLIRPGNASSPADDEPEDLGSEIGVEGNSLYLEEGQKIASSCKFIRFTKSCEEHGFKPDIMARGYFPDLVGMVANFETVTLEKGAGYSSERDPTALIVKNIITYPYESKGKKGSASTIATGKAKTNGKAADKEETGDAAESAALEVLAEIAEEQSGNTIKVTKIKTASFARFAKRTEAKPVKEAAKTLLGDADWLIAKAEDLGYEIDGEQVTFA